MPETQGIIKVNSEYQRLAGKDFFENNGPRLKEYRQKWVEWPKNFHAGEFPLFIDIEVTSACNLRCPFCIRRSKSIKKRFISFDDLKKIIDEGEANNLYGVKFSILGEPLLHPRIHEFVRYAKQKGLVDVYFNTNAVLLTQKISQELIEAGLDRISISFEGYTKDVYERYRVGAKYEAVLANIENLQLLKKKLGVEHPKIRVQTVMLRELEPTLQGYKEFWGKRVDEIGFISYQERIKVKKRGVCYPWACSQVWQRLAVFCDGTISACNHDEDGLLSLGNIRETTIKKVWNAGPLNRIRGLHRKGMAHLVRACDNCYLRDSEIRKLTEGKNRYGGRCLDGEKA